MDILSPLFKTVIVIHRTDRKSFKLIDPIGLLLRIFSLLPSLLLDVYQVKFIVTKKRHSLNDRNVTILFKLVKLEKKAI